MTTLENGATILKKLKPKKLQSLGNEGFLFDWSRADAQANPVLAQIPTSL